MQTNEVLKISNLNFGYSEELIYENFNLKLQKNQIISIVGKSDGYAAKNSDNCIIINPLNKKLITPISESYQSVLWHLFVSHPKLQSNKTKW